ncbi:BadM/Rrf2 family transcriptional regulator [Pseudoduganella sp. FT26W]|uniref:BadM/Rrf2 family transcriptional regulator n=1 Tax=Duganella aquatilis TaxID=2666082 RepID=A0A844DA03_9BURK|nr:Rrf2 family transcriptional regulator [Duganella aquatilis]MRW84179.1 BadM/Rrf2 family transcriptional regulator [Duganella aquatilis]
MTQINVQFSVAAHVMAALATHHGTPVRSAELAGSVNADPSFVRRVVSKLAKAGLVATTRGKTGACTLARDPQQITLLDIYLASQAPAAFSVHAYPTQDSCQVSRTIKGGMAQLLQRVQCDFEHSLAQHTLADFTASLQLAA